MRTILAWFRIRSPEGLTRVGVLAWHASTVLLVQTAVFGATLVGFDLWGASPGEPIADPSVLRTVFPVVFFLAHVMPICGWLPGFLLVVLHRRVGSRRPGVFLMASTMALMVTAVSHDAAQARSFAAAREAGDRIAKQIDAIVQAEGHAPESLPADVDLRTGVRWPGQFTYVRVPQDGRELWWYDRGRGVRGASGKRAPYGPRNHAVEIVVIDTSGRVVSVRVEGVPEDVRALDEAIEVGMSASSLPPPTARVRLIDWSLWAPVGDVGLNYCSPDGHADFPDLHQTSDTGNWCRYF